MDPSGIIGIISVVAQIVTTCTKLGLSWRDAPEDAKRFKNEMDGLYKTLSETSSLLIQNPDFIVAFEGQHSAVLSNLTTLSSPDDESLLSACQDELVRILEGLQKQLEGSRFGWQRFKAMFSGEMTQSAIENLQRRCQVINSMISIDNTTLAVKTNLEVRSLKKDLAGRHLEERKIQILDRITPVDFTTQQIDNLDRRQEGTGKWLLESPEFEAWVLGDRRTLFCPGMPGAGKTMLSSIVIEHLKRRFEGNSTVGVSFMFCNFRRHDEQTPRNLLASILKQLYCTTPEECEEVENTYRHGMSSASKQDIMRCLQAVVPRFSRVYVVIDALDELDENRNMFLEAIWSLQETSYVNIFATSRHIPEIERYFDGSPCIEIRASDGDVMKFLDGQMSKLPLAVRKNEGLQDQIKDAIIQAVQGIGSEAYDVAYENAMERIERQLEDQRSLAKDTLSWICCARRPLDTVELQHALAVEEGTTKLDEDNLPELEDIVSVCAGLVTIDEESKIIRLVHYTTQEFFERTKERWIPEAQTLLAKSCVAYLSYDKFRVTYEEHFERMWINLEKEEQTQLSQSRKDRHRLNITGDSLYRYAAYNWGYHARYINHPDQGTLLFLTDRAYNEDNLNLEDSRGYTPYIYAIWGGDERFLDYLFAQSGLELNMKFKDGYFDLFSIALICENETAVRHLIGMYQSHHETNWLVVLILAIKWGNVYIFKLVTEAGKVDIDVLERHWAKRIAGINGSKFTVMERPYSLLQQAAEEGRIEIVKYLVETQKVDIETQNSLGGTPFSMAVCRGKLEVAQYLQYNGCLTGEKLTPVFS
ncbi:ankyrin repeat protein [Colletotrichum tamarilloi]|uniref:Ankyrin repeat protein n=1 Tax=Colletotrichum tamarilloi TaxID=1209934 RepID=A0ABQ9QN47_9PEZI|nr:ankyrin repeat protein [Colletotrichum tamarilloi]KAK1479142.1 ankyrin repeat protein [Colletotrichum tamarilloi]